MVDIFREVDEEIRREGMVKLARRYGPYILAAALAIVLAAAGYVAWQKHAAQQRLERARTYAVAVAAIGQKDDTAMAALETLASGEDGYAALAYLHAAALKAEAGKTDDAVAIYDRLAADQHMAPAFRSLATVLRAAYSLDTAPPEKLKALLEPLAEPGNPWRYSAQELLALLALRTGDTAKAGELYKALADDLDAPPKLRARATEMLAALQG